MWPTECLEVKCMKIETWTRFWSCEKFFFRPYFLFPWPIWLILHRKSSCRWRCAVTLNQVSSLKVKVIADFFDIIYQKIPVSKGYGVTLNQVSSSNFKITTDLCVKFLSGHYFYLPLITSALYICTAVHSQSACWRKNLQLS